jgi:hypothetical protein
VPSYEAHRDEVERRVSAGEPFSRIETMIESADVTDDGKAALWLLAWSEQPKRVRRSIVTDVLNYAEETPLVRTSLVRSVDPARDSI